MNINPFLLERYFAKYEFSAPHTLCSSDCESFPISELLKLEPDAEEKLKSTWLGYTESLGAPSLREEISRQYKTISTDNVLVHAGAEEAIFSFMNSMLQKGDHIIVQYPCYQSLTEIAETIGCEVTYWKADQAKSWQPDLEFLRASINTNTKVLVINFPHNPTGYYAPLEFYLEIKKLVEKHNIIVFSDEVYRGLEYIPGAALPAFADLNENAVSLNVMSKAYGLAGLRIGWIATKNKVVFNQMAAFKDYLTICNSAPSEFLAELALRHKKELVTRNLNIILNNLGTLDEFFLKHEEKISWVKPNAGPIAFPLFRFGNSASEIAEKLLSEKGVLILPGNLYNNEYKMHFRLGFGRANMPEALNEFDEFLNSVNL